MPRTDETTTPEPTTFPAASLAPVIGLTVAASATASTGAAVAATLIGVWTLVRYCQHAHRLEEARKAAEQG